MKKWQMFVIGGCILTAIWGSAASLIYADHIGGAFCTLVMGLAMLVGQWHKVK